MLANRFLVALVPVVVTVSCTENGDRVPAADTDFQRKVVWGDDTVPQRSLRSIMTYCAGGSRNSGCVDLDNGRPSAAFVVGNGHVVFFDHKAGLVEFDSAGQYIADIGSLGNDPGSYRRVAALGGDSARTFTLWDPDLDRLTVLKRNEVARTAWVTDERVESVLIADTFPVALAIPFAGNIGDRVFATIAPIGSNGKLSAPIATVSAIATTSKEWKMRGVVPSFYWPRPTWSIGKDKSVIYVPPDTVLRIELYNRSGGPEMLVTGRIPFASEVVTEGEIGQLRGMYYQIVRGEPMPPAGTCSPTVPPAGTHEDRNCVMVRHVYAVGKRSPRIRPPVTNIVSFAPHGFWIRTSRVRGDSVTWLIADSTGKLAGSVKLTTAERPIGRHRKLIAIADSTDGRVSVSWRELIQ